jgi:hypothetical protein
MKRTIRSVDFEEVISKQRFQNSNFKAVILKQPFQYTQWYRRGDKTCSSGKESVCPIQKVYKRKIVIGRGWGGG